jgi:hypothetical protein
LQRSLYEGSNWQSLFEIRIAVVDVKNAKGRTGEYTVVQAHFQFMSLK